MSFHYSNSIKVLKYVFVHVSVLMFIKREKIKYSERERGIEKIKGRFQKKKKKK